jgi:type II secretory pathway component PulF
VGDPYPYPKSTGEVPKRVSFIVDSVSHSLSNYPVVFFAIMLSVIAMCLVVMRRGFHRRAIGILLALFCVASVGLAGPACELLRYSRNESSWEIFDCTSRPPEC